MTGEADYCESGGNTVKGYRIKLAGPDGIFDNGFVLIGVGNELGNELACVNVAVVDTSVDVNKRFAGAVEVADEAAGFNSALNCPVVETVDYGEGGPPPELLTFATIPPATPEPVVTPSLYAEMLPLLTHPVKVRGATVVLSNA